MELQAYECGCRYKLEGIKTYITCALHCGKLPNGKISEELASILNSNTSWIQRDGFWVRRIYGYSDLMIHRAVELASQ